MEVPVLVPLWFHRGLLLWSAPSAVAPLYLLLWRLLPCASCGDFYTTQADARTEGYSLKPDNGVPLPRTTLIQFIECRAVELICASDFHPYLLVIGTISLQKEKPGYQLSHKTLGLQSVLPSGCAGVIVVQDMWERPINV